MVQLAEFVASHWIDLAIPLAVTGGLIVVVLLVVCGSTVGGAQNH